MSDTPILHPGDKVLITSGPGMTSMERHGVRLALKNAGVEIVDWTEVSGSGYRIAAILRARPTLVKAKLSLEDM